MKSLLIKQLKLVIPKMLFLPEIDFCEKKNQHLTLVGSLEVWKVLVSNTD